MSRGLIAALLVVATSAAAANPSQDVDRARGLYSRGEYQKTVDTLKPLLYPRAQISDEKELVEAHYLLGVSYFFLGQRGEAQKEFAAMLYIAPDYKMDAVVEDLEVYQLFLETKKQLKKDLDDIRKKREEEERRKRQPQVQTVITINQTSSLINWVPFGAPQLANGRTGWGTFFLTTQSALLLASTGTFVYQLYEYGFPPKRPPDAEIDTVRQLQTVQIGSGALFLLVYGWGVLDAYRTAPPSRTVRQVPAGQDVTVVPWLSPEAAGLGARWEF